MASTSGSPRRRRPWPDLPPEMLGLVLLRLQSHADRVRLRAVCPRWRSCERLPAPLLPWLALPDGTFLSLPDAAVHRLPVPDDVTGRFSTGDTLFLIHRDGRLSVMSPSSAATTRPLPEPHDNFSIEKCYPAANFRKVVVSSDRLVALLSYSRVFVFTPELPAGAPTRMMKWAPRPSTYAHNSILDIALFKGKLYVLSADEELYVLDAGDRHITAVCCVRKTLQVWHGPYPTIIYAQRDYLVVSGGQLLWVKRRINVPSKWRRERRTKARTYQFDVFEAADLSGGCGRWREVHTLMGNALFEWLAAPTAEAYADGQMSGPSAYVRSMAAAHRAPRRMETLGVERATPTATLGVCKAVGVPQPCAPVPLRPGRLGHGVI
ncbi:hypothetical protein QYE76_027886 [Lolium multiflorum]|uniref:F-box domain-containing protein n=1 Tax=Lolium multiflorum TaxID=4521 RepID=A0AAD8QNH2_LOLMU|nr:hypothetical protein QYE76_027886 [Lolium multiflorum]